MQKYPEIFGNLTKRAFFLQEMPIKRKETVERTKVIERTRRKSKQR